jgi:hypothetical protein
LENIRIDKGIKRGSKKYMPPPALQTGQSLAKRPLHQVAPEERARIAHNVLDRYINGEQVANIAPEYGVSDVTIYALLLREHQEAWKDIQTARALARLEQSQDELQTAPDALSLARARERVRSAQWELERLFSRLYGQKQEVTHNLPNGPLINIQLSGQSVVHLQQDAPQQSAQTGVVSTQHVISKE